jgi:mono/diheme cytochrome c family protein
VGRSRRRRLLAPAALASLTVFTLTAAGGCSAADDDEAALARGREHYLAQCSTCHQPDDRGFAQIYLNVAENPIVRLEDPDPVIEVVLHGRGPMPSFNHRPGEELAEIITYIRHDWGTAPRP